MHKLRFLPVLGLLAVISSTACAAHTSDDDGADSESEDFTAGSASNIDIGFNMGWGDEFDYYTDFFDNQTSPVGKKLCHTYTSFRVGYEDKPDISEVSNDAPHGGRAALQYVMQRAEGHCDELLISFKSLSNRVAPSEDEYTKAMVQFFTVPWKSLTGFTGTFTFTAWNEPNNPEGPGNGLGVPIHADLAARYYLALSKICASPGHDCEVAAGDFASNGNYWDAFEINCANDNVEDLCHDKSSHDQGNAGPSYLDTYKNTIALKSKDYGQPDRPKYFAFHGWHDINNYLNKSDPCTSYDTCAERRLLTSLGGSWGGVEIWDTETGVDQSNTVDISDPDQACGAAWMLKLHTLSNRIKRIYYTRLHGGGGQLVKVDDNGTHITRPALDVLKNRQTEYKGATCK